MEVFDTSMALITVLSHRVHFLLNTLNIGVFILLLMTGLWLFHLHYGPEFLVLEFQQWVRQHYIELKQAQPGKPAQNTYIERFNRTYREDMLDAY